MPISEAMKRAKKKHYDNNRDKYRAYNLVASRKYQLEHKEEVLEKKKVFYEKHKEDIKQRTLTNYYYKKENDADEYFKQLRKMKLF